VDHPKEDQRAWQFEITEKTRISVIAAELDIPVSWSSQAIFDGDFAAVKEAGRTSPTSRRRSPPGGRRG
jgi:hypothetical protein